MKKRAFFLPLIFLIIFSLLTFISIVQAQEGGFGVEKEKRNDPKEAEKTIEQKGSGTFVFSGSQIINLPGGNQITVSGTIVVEGGKIVRADNIKFLNTDFKDVANFVATSDGYTIESAKQLEQGGFKITNGKGITFSNGVLKADQVDSFSSDYAQVLNGKNVRVFSDSVQGDYAGTFMQDGALATDVYNFNSKKEKFSVEQADSLLSGDVKVESIENTEFTITSDKIVMATGKGTTLRITGKFLKKALNRYSVKYRV